MTAVSTIAERILQSLGITDPQEIDLEAIAVFTTIGRSMAWSRHSVEHRHDGASRSTDQAAAHSVGSALHAEMPLRLRRGTPTGQRLIEDAAMGIGNDGMAGRCSFADRP